MSGDPNEGGPCVRYIAGDIGGTNSRLSLIERRVAKEKKAGAVQDSKEPPDNVWSGVDAEGCQERIVARKTYRSKEYPHLSVIVELFLNEFPGPHPSSCVLAVAGPVNHNKCNATNLNWFLDGDQMAVTLKIPHVILLNDFAAVGYGLTALQPCDVIPVTTGVLPDPHAPIACLGAGTGLGECFLTHNGKEYDVWPTEGGHTSFAPRNDIEYGLAKFIRDTERLPTLSVERIVSGPAFPRIYQFFSLRFPTLVNHEVSREIFDPKNDASEIITKHALNKTDQLCIQVQDFWVQMYGSEAGDLALKTLPFGGLYIAGGVAPKIYPSILDQNKFIESMVQKGRMRPVLERIPVYIVMHPSCGMLGSRVIARRRLRAELVKEAQKRGIKYEPVATSPAASLAAPITSAL